MPLSDAQRFASPLPPAAVRQALCDAVEPASWPFALVFKLSGGGIVSRVMDAPQTHRLFFGEVSAERVRIAVASRGRQVTAFQPILRVAITPQDPGSQLDVTFRPHPQTRTLSGLFAVAGFTLIGAAIPALLQGMMVGWVALVLGILLMIFPPIRARISFRDDTQRAVAALARAVPLQPSPGAGL